MMRNSFILFALATLVPSAPARQQDDAAVVRAEFIYAPGPVPSVHASTIAETKSALVAAWFGGRNEGAPDVGIWMSRYTGAAWTTATEVANGLQADGRRFACWNPVLFASPTGTLLLFYKVGPNPREWWGMMRTSHDDGATWSEAERLPPGILGPIKNKPFFLHGLLIAPSSTESMDTPPKWRVRFEVSSDLGRSWSSHAPSSNGPTINAIQPAILIHPGERLQAVGRTQSGRIFESWSTDNGRSWSALELTSLPNPNSGLDAVTLRDGRQLLVYNHTSDGRTPLNVAVSRDGKLWEAALVLESEPGEYSYPAVIQSADGLVHITYTWKRQRIKHVVIDPAKLHTTPMRDGKWPPTH